MAKKSSNKPVKTQAHNRAVLFSAMSSPLRLQILDLLSTGECNVTKLVEKLNAEQPNVSRHLSVLRAARLVQVRRNGLERLYRITNPLVRKLIDTGDQFLSGELAGA